jgi:hypothetical protein
MSKPIWEGQPGQWHEGKYRYVRHICPGLAIFKEGENGKEEVFAKATHGVCGWALKWRGTYWEFIRER